MPFGELVELLLIAAVALASWALPARVVSLARDRRVGVLAGALVGLAVSVGMWRLYDPQPAIHDEFAHLLAADTFAHARLANPTHPFWEHFETMHVLQRPSYASKFPPGQGLLLAAGQVLGAPRIGVWLGMAALGASLVWMLQAYLPARLALLVGLLGVLRLGTSGNCQGFGYWSHSYWGGALAATGGALLYGALPRLLRRPGGGTAGLFALGLLMLANTRPVEGAIVSLPAVGLFALRLLREGRPARRAPLRRAAVPLAALLAAGGGLMLVYNVRVTGSALLMPNVEHMRQYAVTPYLLWQTPWPEPSYSDPVIRRFYTGWELDYYRYQHAWPGLVASVRSKLECLWRYYLGGALSVPLLLLPVLLRRPWLRLLALPLLLLGVVFVQFTWVQAHYAAPAAALVYVFVGAGLRELGRRGARGSPVPAALARAVPVACVLGAALVAIQIARARPTERNDWARQRARMLRTLEQSSARHLVIVRYDRDHDAHQEWVYNAADVDAAPVVWAREKGEPSDSALRAYFADRRAWLLFADERPPRLEALGPPPGRR